MLAPRFLFTAKSTVIYVLEQVNRGWMEASAQIEPRAFRSGTVLYVRNVRRKRHDAMSIEGALVLFVRA